MQQRDGAWRAIAFRSTPSRPTPYLLITRSSGTALNTRSSIGSSPTMARSCPRSSAINGSPDSTRPDSLNVASP
jgi:hypothetical protein